MNRYDSRSWESNQWQPIVQTWGSPQTRYQSAYDYTCDPVAARTVQFWNSRNWEKEYSSREKAFYPVTPYNARPSHYAPLMGEFDFTRLRQTDVLDLIYSRPTPPQSGTVPLAHVISPQLNKMGAIKDLTTGENLGTCTLIAHNLVLVARHAVEGRSIRNLNVTFGYKQFKGSFSHAGQTSFDRVVEEDSGWDYAIIQLKEPLGKRLGFVSLNTEGHVLTEPALLHYPLGKPLKVSVHGFVQTQYQADYFQVNHDTDYFSSGGAYFDPMGRMIGMHLGAELQEETMNLMRYALPLETIVRYKPDSLLQKFAQGQLLQAESYTVETYRSYLHPTQHNYLIDEEGRESEKILRGLLTRELKRDRRIKLNKNGTILFSEANLTYIANTYPTKFNTFKSRCLGITGLHGKTNLFSVKNNIESDHTIPHNVWKLTTNPKMVSIVAGGGKRKGENDMPAITLPYGIHRNLLTTGGVPGYKAFHRTLLDLCDKDQIDEALLLCYREYEKKGLDLNLYESRIKKSLKDHVDLGLISNAQKREIISKIF